MPAALFPSDEDVSDDVFVGEGFTEKLFRVLG